MSQTTSTETDPSQAGGHPHDLLARLYREIGISAVAAALEVDQLQAEDRAGDFESPWQPLVEDLAA